MSDTPRPQVRHIDREEWPGERGAETVFRQVTEGALRAAFHHNDPVGGLFGLLIDCDPPPDAHLHLTPPTDEQLDCLCDEAGLGQERFLVRSLIRHHALTYRHVGHCISRIRGFDRGVREALEVLGESRMRGLDDPPPRAEDGE